MENTSKNKKLLIIIACIVAAVAIAVAAIYIANNNSSLNLTGTTTAEEESTQQGLEGMDLDTYSGELEDGSQYEDVDYLGEIMLDDNLDTENDNFSWIR